MNSIAMHPFNNFIGKFEEKVEEKIS